MISEHVTGTSISLDHAIQLVSRRVYNYHKAPSVKIYLAIIEEKVSCYILLLIVNTEVVFVSRRSPSFSHINGPTQLWQKKARI